MIFSQSLTSEKATKLKYLICEFKYDFNFSKGSAGIGFNFSNGSTETLLTTANMHRRDFSI